MPSAMNINSRRSIHDRDGDEQDEEAIDSSASVNELGESHESPVVEYSSASDVDENERSYSLDSRSSRHRDRFEMSRSVPRTPQRPKLPKYHRSTTPQIVPEYSYTSHRKDVTFSDSGKSSGSPLLICTIIALLVVLFGVGYYFVYPEEKPLPLKCSYEKLKIKFPEQNDKVWRILRTGVESILNKHTNEPAVYLMVHDGGEHIKDMVKVIASHTSICFGKNMQPVEMVNSDFTSSEAETDYGHAIEKYKAKIKKGNVILIANLNEIPAASARAFHTICDTHSPIVEDVVIFLTLIIPNDEQGNVESITENTLIDLWGSKLESNELYPLITRVTDQVIALKT